MCEPCHWRCSRLGGAVLTYLHKAYYWILTWLTRVSNSDARQATYIHTKIKAIHVACYLPYPYHTTHSPENGPSAPTLHHLPKRRARIPRLCLDAIRHDTHDTQATNDDIAPAHIPARPAPQEINVMRVAEKCSAYVERWVSPSTTEPLYIRTYIRTYSTFHTHTRVVPTTCCTYRYKGTVQRQGLVSKSMYTVRRCEA